MISKGVELQSAASPVGCRSSPVLACEQWLLNAHLRSSSTDDKVYVGSKQNEKDKEHFFIKLNFSLFKEYHL